MRWLMIYFRQVFCNHDWHVEEGFVDVGFKVGEKVYMRCKKCGHHHSHWKYV
jgi:hypothetical protein